MKEFNNVGDFKKRRYDSISNRTIFYEKDNRINSVLELVRETKKTRKTKKKTRVLDIGCYDGTISAKIKDEIGGNCEIYGIDISENVLKEARSIFLAKLFPA